MGSTPIGGVFLSKPGFCTFCALGLNAVAARVHCVVLGARLGFQALRTFSEPGLSISAPYAGSAIASVSAITKFATFTLGLGLTFPTVRVQAVGGSAVDRIIVFGLVLFTSSALLYGIPLIN